MLDFIDKLNFGKAHYEDPERGDLEGCWFPQWLVHNKKRRLPRMFRIGHFVVSMNDGAPGSIAAMPDEPGRGGHWWSHHEDGSLDSLYLGLFRIHAHSHRRENGTIEHD